ncbi:hypothetical protein ACFC08_33945 [Streptomyces sp. NPDC056112]|uniref:hypothetical protein n=1 Tax=unclassified Streptomyces TaxID=2593676 RepID=UPI001CD490D4|nr:MULTISPECIES: hypothetical protein [unclassified Streptomyces]
MAWEHDRQVVTALAQAAVTRAAPEELSQFEVTADAFFAASSRSRRIRQRDDPLGLGLDSIVVLTSTVALSVAVEVLKHLATDYSEKALGGLWRRVRAIAGRRAESAPLAAAHLPQLTGQQLAELHALAQQKALAARLPSDLAVLLADGIVAELARSSSETNTASGPAPLPDSDPAGQE